ncbi:HTH-type transcriptional activator RhaS [Sporomusa carbonis]|uniref:helix-turn-helix domain-containing protein n=1 Tax=Sporomusa carbonis TaxID=3076075 RepID=UPI003A73D8F4
MDIDANGRRRDYDMDWEFPVEVIRNEYKELGPMFASHWHEQFQMLYFDQGEALIYCNSKPIQVRAGELVVINGSDLHYGENLCRQLVYYLIKVDLSFLLSNQADLCQTKYMAPLVQSQILFRNYIGQDDELLEQVRQLIGEYYRKEIGYELAVKSYIYRILVLLMRHYGEQAIDETELGCQRKTLHLLRPVLEYMDRHYHEKVSLGQLAAMANMSRHYFCRLFRKITGKPPVEYMNCLRINQAVTLLQESDLNISEIAGAVGFNDSNYFSRLFKKYKHVSPSEMQKGSASRKYTAGHSGLQ